MPAWPLGTNEARMTAAASALRSTGWAWSAATAPNGTMAVSSSRWIRVRMVDSLTLEAGGSHLSAFGVLGQEHGQVDRRLRPERELRHALLAEAVADAPVHRAHLALLSSAVRCSCGWSSGRLIATPREA